MRVEKSFTNFKTFYSRNFDLIKRRRLIGIKSVQGIKSTSTSKFLAVELYSEDISVICAFDKSIAELNLVIGAELANKFSSVRDINPEIWTPDLEKYIDNVLKKSGKQFKNATLVDVLDDLFRLYCEKVFLDL
uniref:Uncharacterized protein n=1 Tax=Rhizophagus irregularis (strain DAOM 181602 / DAOM 197198 / MUCL 43194) TaxID=747089 RepID=U9T503_RHIID